VGSISSLVRKTKSFVFAFSILSLKFCSLLFYAGVDDLAITGNQSLICCGYFNSPYVLKENAKKNYKICLIVRRK
jgi:hypothetical protein